ncbi:hydroxymethylglutaryl-CoA lyase [Paraferrimonas sp. SM1919]|uniref:hydroxymethylglutaryl-CoA lyase n=1 Tax=Paraferrimonas sp. SM1919 TaxID=2662263 RepID=UPI0013D87938|nr:hydroxymethylglutaryl-CoA lyase [Paraferrimonas sp. SM1919]
MDNVIITDVGPRDGLQNQAVHLSPETRLSLIQNLLECGLQRVEVGAFVSPKAVPAMAGTDVITRALANISAQDFQVLIPNAKGYDIALANGAKTMMFVVCASETMNQKNVRMSIEDSINDLAQLYKQAKADGVKLITCIAVAWQCPFEGKTEPRQVWQMAEALQEIGADSLLIADTIGAASPTAVKNLMAPLVKQFGQDNIGCHFHDTRAMGLANVYAAYEAGVRHFDAAIGGLGGCPFAPGATGNVATEDVVQMFQQMGVETNIDLDKLYQVGQQAGTLVKLESGGRGQKFRSLQLEKGNSLNEL